MNRSTLAVLLVGLLTIQGSVTGFVVGDASVMNASNVTEDDTTAERSVSAIFSNQSTAATTTTEEQSTNDTEGSSSDETTITGGGDSNTTPTTATLKSNATTAKTPTEKSPTAESTATSTQARENSESQSLPTSLSTDGAPQTTGSPSAATTQLPSEAANVGVDTRSRVSSTSVGAPNESPREIIPSARVSSRAAGAGVQRGGLAAASSRTPTGVATGTARSGTGTTVVSPDAEFSVVSVSSNVPVGGTGTISVTIENTGEDATNAVVNLQSLSGDLRFGQSATTSRFVGEWEEGENKTIEVRARATRTATTANYPVQTTISYEDDGGNASRSAPLTFGVALESEQQFSLSGVDGDLYADESGTISGTVTNEGPKTAANAVLRFAPNGSRAVIPRQSGYVLGDLAPGESESFELPVYVNSTVEPGQRQIPLVVQYYDSAGNPMRSEPLTARVDIAAENEDFDIVAISPTVESGEQGILSVTINNTGENITDATVSFQSLSGGILFGRSANATQFVAEWNAGERRTFEFEVQATESATEQTYPMGVSLTYEDADGDQAQSGPFRFGVTPAEQRDDFRVVSSSADVQVGGEGTVSLTLENNGENAAATVVTIQSLSGDITFGRSLNATQFVGKWPVGAQRTVTFNATASNRTDVRSYPFRVSVSYEDTDGDRRQAGPFTVGVTPLPEQAFDITNATSTLRVGSEGTVSVAITNRGPRNAQNAVVRLLTRSQTINPQETESVIGSLPAGESATVSFPVEVTDSAEAGQRQFSFVVEYETREGDTRRSGTLDVQVAVAPEREAFAVERANASIAVGSSDTVTLNVTNNRNSVVRDVNAKAYVDDPLSISSDEAYIAQLAPNETTQISFDVSASGSASEGQYPLSVDFEYGTASGETKLSQTYEIPVTVTAAEGSGLFSSLGLTVGLVALFVLIGIGWVWSRR